MTGDWFSTGAFPSPQFPIPNPEVFKHMHGINNLLLLLVILLNFFTLGSSRLGACIQAVALQGAILAVLPVTIHGLSVHALVLAGGALALKGVFIPWLLFRAIREVRIRREVEPRPSFSPIFSPWSPCTAGPSSFPQPWRPFLPVFSFSSPGERRSPRCSDT
ncbi:MAG: hypothetical protein P8Z70_08925 [Desulfuromonadales bacterium]